MRENICKRDKKRCIFNYIQNLTTIDLSSLGFNLIKSDDFFKKAYKMHDIASSYIIQQYLKLGYDITELDVDLRNHRVMIKNDVPDYIAETDKVLFCFDIKSKGSIKYFGWVNERALNDYKKLAKSCDVSIYLIFVEVRNNRVTGKVGYCNINDEIIKDNHRAWNGNKVVIYMWKEGLPTV